MSVSQNNVITRTYYRNAFFHMGHIKTMLDNQRFAMKNNGICYAIIDDRQDPLRIENIKESFKYLDLNCIKVISVKQYHSKIMRFTEKLVLDGHIYLCRCNIEDHNPSSILNLIKNPSEHFQLRLRTSKINIDDPSIGYTLQDSQGILKLTLIFDYIIKVLDRILKVTDIISTSPTEISDVKDREISKFFENDQIKHHRLDTYIIHDFKYSKRGWDVDESDAYLLTFKGLHARHIPVDILRAFYIHASQMGEIKIQYLSKLMSIYMKKQSVRTYAVIDPIKVIIDDWQDKRTEYVCNMKLGKITHHPLTNVFYINRQDFGMDRKVNLNQSTVLISGPVFKCNSIDHTDTLIHVSINSDKSVERRYPSIPWVSSKWGCTPCQVLFYMYNWFYTGYNRLLKPQVHNGYIDQNVFSDLDKIYYIDGHGYFIYDRSLSSKQGVPCFLRICKF